VSNSGYAFTSRAQEVRLLRVDQLVDVLHALEQSRRTGGRRDHARGVRTAIAIIQRQAPAPEVPSLGRR
jgi:hypothetical protein